MTRRPNRRSPTTSMCSLAAILTGTWPTIRPSCVDSEDRALLLERPDGVTVEVKSIDRLLEDRRDVAAGHLEELQRRPSRFGRVAAEDQAPRSEDLDPVRGRPDGELRRRAGAQIDVDQLAGVRRDDPGVPLGHVETERTARHVDPLRCIGGRRGRCLRRRRRWRCRRVARCRRPRKSLWPRTSRRSPKPTGTKPARSRNPPRRHQHDDNDTPRRD